MFIIGQINKFTPFKESGNLRLFSLPMMSIVQYEILKNAYECRCESYECIANETTTLICIYTLPGFLSVFYLLGSAQSANSPSYCYSLSAFSHYTT